MSAPSDNLIASGDSSTCEPHYSHSSPLGSLHHSSFNSSTNQKPQETDQVNTSSVHPISVKQNLYPLGPSGILIALVTDPLSNTDFILKSSPRSLETEFKIQSSLQSTNIVKPYEYYYQDGRYHILMEYCKELDLFIYLQDKELSETEAKRVFLQLIDALETCHRAKIAHLDIKPENCFVDADGNLKLGDFGAAKVLQDQELVYEYCGTPEYMSPELHLKQPYQGDKADIFAAGKVLFEIALNFLPFQYATFADPNYKLLISNPVEFWALKRRRLLTKGKATQWNPDLLNLLELMLEDDPNQRPDIDLIKAHPWLQY